jgi:hypothetical protein
VVAVSKLVLLTNEDVCPRLDDVQLGVTKVRRMRVSRTRTDLTLVEASQLG